MSSGMLYAKSVEAADRAGRQELLSLAQIAALQVDPVAHESLVSADQQDSLSYQVQSDRLAAVLQRTRNVRFVYTVRKHEGKYWFVLDPTPPGDADNDGIDDKSYLLDPMDDISPAMVECFETGIATVEEEPFADRWGTWLSAFSPIRDAEGKVIAVIGLDRDYRLIQRELSEIRKAFQSSLFLVGTISLGAAWLFAGIFGRPGVRKFTIRATQLRRPAIEFLLVAIVMAVVTDATIAAFYRNDLRREQDLILSRMARLTTAENGLQDESLLSTDTEKELRQSLEEGFARSETPWLAGLVRLDPRIGVETPRPNPKSTLTNALAEERRIQQDRLSLVVSSIRGLDSRLYRILYLAAGLAAFAIVVLRYASQQDQRVAEIESENSIANARYRAVADNLPIGLFVFRDGHVTFGNNEWERQVARQENQTLDDAWLTSLHDEDRDAVVAAILQADQTGTPFELTCRLIGSDGSIIHVQARGEPIYDRDGEFQHLICFHADLTAIVEAKLALQQAYSELESKNQLLSAALAELEENLESVVRSLVKAVEAKDPYTAGHSERVMQYSLWLGEALGLGPYELRILEMGSLVHDVGKIGIPDHILTKPGELTDAEFEMVKQHPLYGVNIIDRIGVFSQCVPIVRWHHERLDGTGYPDRLVGNEIPYLVRITAIADVFDAMVSNRAYRKGLDVEFVLRHLEECGAKGQIDAELVQVFVEVIRRRGIIESGPDQAAA